MTSIVAKAIPLELISEFLSSSSGYESQHDIFFKFNIDPPKEIRTGTKSEPRYFSVALRFLVDDLLLLKQDIIIRMDLALSTDLKVHIKGLNGETSLSFCPGNLGEHLITFSTLSITVTSLKHQEREFSIIASAFLKGEKIAECFSRPFYSFSHQNVLKRRKFVEIRSISPSVLENSADRLHLIGKFFMQGPNVTVLFCFEKADYSFIFMKARNVEIFSDTVIFFDPPDDLDCLEGVCLDPFSGLNFRHIISYIVYSNDGRNFSYGVPLILKQGFLLESDDFLDLSDFESSSLFPNKKPHMISRI